MRMLFRLLRGWRDAKAASRGPSAMGKRVVRRRATASTAQ